MCAYLTIAHKRNARSTDSCGVSRSQGLAAADFGDWPVDALVEQDEQCRQLLDDDDAIPMEWFEDTEYVPWYLEKQEMVEDYALSYLSDAEVHAAVNFGTTEAATPMAPRECTRHHYY